MKIFEGVIVPMVTPVNADQSVDLEATEKIIETFIENDSAPFVLGTTGEFASCDAKQKHDLVKKTVEVTAGRVKTFAGISGTSLSESIDTAKAYRDMGVDVMVTTLPYYYPITEAEMTVFFEQLADAIECPLVLYNMPAMVGAPIPLTVAETLSKHPHIVGMKDSERDIDRIDQSVDMWKDRDDFGFYLGWAAQSAHAVLRGADGIVPSTANFVPELFKQLFDAAKKQDAPEAQRLQDFTDQISLIYQKDRKLNQSLPALKVLMSEMDLCQPYAISPMLDIPVEDQQQLRQSLQQVWAEWQH